MAETKSSLAVVCDAGPLVHLDELAALDLLADFSAVLVPEAVWLEVAQHRPDALTREGVSLQRVDVVAEPDQLFSVLSGALALGAGEQQALQLARQHEGAILLTDDAAARLAAESLSLRVHGTLGILLRSARRGQRAPEQVLKLLQAIDGQSTLFIKLSLLTSIIDEFHSEFGL